MINYKEWSNKGKGKPAKTVDWNGVDVQPPTKDSKTPEKPKAQPQVKESNNIDWGSKIPRDIQLTNKVIKPEKQPQVKENTFSIKVLTDGFSSEHELRTYLNKIFKTAVGANGVKDVKID